MTIEEAITELENGEWWDLIGEVSCDADASIRFHAALDMAIAALRAQQVDATPLTLSELREMDGEPVWVTQPDKILPSFWGLVDVKDGAVSGVLYCGTFEDYDTEWLAYRCKLEEV